MANEMRKLKMASAGHSSRGMPGRCFSGLRVSGLQAALRRVALRALRAGRRLAVGLRRALPERFIGLRATGLAAFFFAVFAMVSLSLFFQCVILPKSKQQYLHAKRYMPLVN
jgi:hypothetical protein